MYYFLLTTTRSRGTDTNYSKLISNYRLSKSLLLFVLKVYSIENDFRISLCGVTKPQSLANDDTISRSLWYPRTKFNCRNEEYIISWYYLSSQSKIFLSTHLKSIVSDWRCSIRNFLKSINGISILNFKNVSSNFTFR